MVGVLLWMLAEMPRQDSNLAAALATIGGWGNFDIGCDCSLT